MTSLLTSPKIRENPATAKELTRNRPPECKRGHHRKRTRRWTPISNSRIRLFEKGHRNVRQEMMTIPIKKLLVVATVIFCVLAGLLAARFIPGQNPVMHRVTVVALSPTLPMLRLIKATGLWPLSEKADLVFVALLGGLTVLTSLLYAGAVLAGFNLIKKRKRNAEHHPEPYFRLAPEKG